MIYMIENNLSSFKYLKKEKIHKLFLSKRFLF